MKTKDEGTAWLRSHGWVQCDRGWRKPGMTRAPLLTGHGWVRPRLDGGRAPCGGPDLCMSCQAESMMLRAEQQGFPPMTTQQATTMQGEV